MSSLEGQERPLRIEINSFPSKNNSHPCLQVDALDLSVLREVLIYVFLASLLRQPACEELAIILVRRCGICPRGGRRGVGARLLIRLHRLVVGHCGTL